MPREIVGKDPASLNLVDFNLVVLKPNEVRVKVEFASPKHGTELHNFFNKSDEDPVYYDEATHSFLTQTSEMRATHKPGLFRPGNMWVGRITEMGRKVAGYQVGQRIAGYGSLREVHTVCINAGNQAGLGAINDVLIMPEEMSWKAALCYDPCQFALAGTRDSHLRLGDTCCVSGLGAIGLMAAQMARLHGAKSVIVSDPIAKRREIALACGADYAIDPIHEDAGLRMKQLTGNMGTDVVIETSGSYPSLQAALRGVAYGGRISVVGWYGRDKGGFDLGHEAHMNNATLFFSRACSEPNPDYPRWNWNRLNITCWDMLSKGLINCEPVIDPVVPFENAGDAYRQCVVENPSLSVKLGVQY